MYTKCTTIIAALICVLFITSCTTHQKFNSSKEEAYYQVSNRPDFSSIIQYWRLSARSKSLFSTFTSVKTQFINFDPVPESTPTKTMIAESKDEARRKNDAFERITHFFIYETTDNKKILAIYSDNRPPRIIYSFQLD